MTRQVWEIYLSLSAQVTITKELRLGGLISRRNFFLGHGGWKLEIRASADLVRVPLGMEDFLPWVRGGSSELALWPFMQGHGSHS